MMTANNLSVSTSNQNPEEDTETEVSNIDISAPSSSLLLPNEEEAILEDICICHDHNLLRNRGVAVDKNVVNVARRQIIRILPKICNTDNQIIVTGLQEFQISSFNCNQVNEGSENVFILPGTIPARSDETETIIGNEASKEILVNSLAKPEEEQGISHVSTSTSTGPNVKIPVTNTIPINVNGMSLQIKRFIFSNGLCRVCLLAKEHMFSIFDTNSGNSDGGDGEMSRTCNLANKYNMATALQTLLNIQVEMDDGLPSMICLDCADSLLTFSAFRKRIEFGQNKLNHILTQVKNSLTPTVIPSLGESDDSKVGLFKNYDFITRAKKLLNESKYSHLVSRNIPDKVWDKIFCLLSTLMGYKSTKLKTLECYVMEAPFVNGWFCNVCQLTVHGKQEAYFLHYLYSHQILEENVLFPCEICGARLFKGESSITGETYSDHWIQHFFFFDCTECDKKLPSARSILIHKRSAHACSLPSLKNKSHECNVCQKLFRKKSHFVAHKRTHLSAAERMEQGLTIICPHCHKSLSGNLSTHISLVHSEEKRWKCLECSKTFRRKEVLVNHQKTMHPKEQEQVSEQHKPRFRCDECGIFLKSLSTKRMHQFRHKGEKPFKCNQCELAFFTLTSLKSHQVSHSEVRNFVCTICSKAFKRQTYLTEHLRIHSNEKPFECPICQRRIRIRANYHKHVQVHKKNGTWKEEFIHQHS